MLKDNDTGYFEVFVFIGLTACVLLFGIETVKYFPNNTIEVSATAAPRELGGCACE